jgi:primosomal replication protein N
VINGTVTSVETLRHTPAGLPLLSFVFYHASENSEVGLKRKIECELNAVLMGDLTKIPIKVGNQFKAAGFLVKRSVKSTQLVMHIQKIELIQNS